VLRYRANLDQFPLFGREGHALPLGRNVQHTGEINAAAPLEALWIFGKPATSLEGFEQVKIVADGTGSFVVHTVPNVGIEIFGDSAAVTVERSI
jgi:alpha-glucosidase (family GH31 glycosyl hydrolase)